MINCILIDDEISALRGLSYELESFKNQIAIKGEFISAKEAINYLKNHPIDLVFLDIEMPEINGLSFLESFPERTFYVIFTTAYSKYAINAIKLDALDYLLKPVDFEDLEQAVKKVERNLNKKKQENLLETALDRINLTESASKKIKVYFDGKIHFINPNDILYCEGEGNYCTIHLENGAKMLLSQKLKQIESLLPELIFYRLHNSYVVNLNKITGYYKNEGYVELSGGKNLPVSRNKRGEILDKL
ncbi:MAG: LytTR family DNA-binding domain-containing protein [Flavobacteriaceae bacterium]